VLIAASRGGPEQAARALAILDDPARQFASSAFVRLEVLPQARFNQRFGELAFYERFFSTVSVWATDRKAIVDGAAQGRPRAASKRSMPCMFPRRPITGAMELVTTEKPTRSLRARAVKVATIYPGAE